MPYYDQRLILLQTKEYPFASVGINITSMLFTLLNIKQQALLNEPYYSPAWNSPLILFFCQCSVYYHTHHKQKETTDLKNSNNTNSLNNSADLRNSPKHVNNKPLNTVNNISLSPIDLTLDEDHVIIIDEESPRAKIDSPLNNLNRSNSSANNSNASDDNEAREEKFPFEELFCYLMFLLDSLWDNMEAKYMVGSLISPNSRIRSNQHRIRSKNRLKFCFRLARQQTNAYCYRISLKYLQIWSNASLLCWIDDP